MVKRLKLLSYAILLAPLLLSSAQRITNPSASKSKGAGAQAAGASDDVLALPPPPGGPPGVKKPTAQSNNTKGASSEGPFSNATMLATISEVVTTATEAVTATSVLSSSASHGELTLPTPSNATLAKRSANPLCLNTVELSCLNLAANCLDSINSGNRNNIWSVRSCATAGTCYGVGDLIASISCQTGFTLTNSDEADLDYNVYAGIVGSCAFAPGGCAITQQNYIDWYYGTLTLISTANWPSSVNVVIAYFNTVRVFGTTGTVIWYSHLNNWLHLSSYPPPPPTTTSSGYQYTPVAWNPNPAPSSGAVSQTFVKAGTTVIIAVPVVTTTVVIVGTTITLDPGGTPIVGVVPPDISQPNAVTPTFDFNPVLPPTASTITFKSGTWTSVVAVPTSTNSPVTVHGPPDDGNDDDDDDDWFLALGLLGPLLLGIIPGSVSVIPGIIPVPVPPPNWPPEGPWPPPPPPPNGNHDGDDDDDDDDDDPPTCSSTLPAYFEPYDPSGEEPDDDQSYLKRHYDIDYGMYNQTGNVTFPHIFKRANRNIRLGDCGAVVSLPSKGFTVGDYFTYKNPNVIPAVPSAGTNLYPLPNSRHQSYDGKIKEHVFELRYIADFVRAKFPGAGNCGWLMQNMWGNTLNGVAVSQLLYDAIDHTGNFVWADEAINKAKSSVVNGDTPNPGTPPLNSEILGINSLNNALVGDKVKHVETLIRAFGVLGQYFTQNGGRYKGGAQRVQDILARITPTTPVFPPLDSQWNDFVRTTVQGYSTGITSRGQNMLTKYRLQVGGVLATALAQVPLPQPPPSVPSCWKVFHDATIAARLAGGGINWLSFVVDALPHPTCNTVGSNGMVIFWYDANGNPVGYVGNLVAKLYATSTPYYGLGVPSVNAIYYDVDLDAAGRYPGGQCAGIRFAMPDLTGGTTYPVAKFDQDCHGNSGKAVSDLYLRSNGQSLKCYLNVFNDRSGGEAIDCGPSQAAVQTCITHMNQIDNRPNGYLYVPVFRFWGQ